MTPHMTTLTYAGTLDELAIDMAQRIARADVTTPWSDLPYSDQGHYLNIARIALGALAEDDFEIEDLPIVNWAVEHA